MAPDGLKLELTAGPFEHLHHITAPHHKRLTQGCQGLAQVNQRLPAEQPLPLRAIRLLPQLRLDDVERKHRTTLGSLVQRPVIVHPQIPFEPDNLQGWQRRSQSRASTMLANLDWTVLRKPATFSRRVISAAARKQRICSRKTPL